MKDGDGVGNDPLDSKLREAKWPLFVAAVVRNSKEFDSLADAETFLAALDLANGLVCLRSYMRRSDTPEEFQRGVEAVKKLSKSLHTLVLLAGGSKVAQAVVDCIEILAMEMQIAEIAKGAKGTKGTKGTEGTAPASGSLPS